MFLVIYGLNISQEYKQAKKMNFLFLTAQVRGTRSGDGQFLLWQTVHSEVPCFEVGIEKLSRLEKHNKNGGRFGPQEIK